MRYLLCVICNGLKIKTGGITPPSPSNCTECAFARLISSISTITLALQIYNLFFLPTKFFTKNYDYQRILS